MKDARRPPNEPVTDDLRIHAAGVPGPNPSGEFVLYWMQGVAMRSTGNPALTFAIEQANLRRVPVLVYQGLRSDYPWASDRIHTFILEAARDLAESFRARGIQYAFYLETAAGRGAESPLVALARRAVLVVTEFFPTFIQPRQLKQLRRRIATPVVAVDATTLVPLRYHQREYVTARSIRPVLMEALPHYLHPLPDRDPLIRRRVELPFDPLDHGSPIAELVGRCAIDHSVPPSPVIRGGERAARARLEDFVKHGLARYDQRGDPNVDATSRLSPHLHFGTIAIQDVLLLAREAGPADQFAKFLDEALVWRELAHNLCYLNRRHRTLEAVPAWAQAELDDHGADPRPALYDDDTLETARTHDPLWNAAQRSLLRDGELHNYLRMLWGKSVLLWTTSAAEALRVLEHLNHKYALDGRDPSSYGGILWCFGRYDRPFYRRPIFGTVRYMSLGAAAKKFSVPAYLARYPIG
ncbi:MAG: deoxyribodipyrimidine photo-lyase [Gemmatimonadales bacterium]